MVERRRKPLVLSSTKALINSVLKSPSKTEEIDQTEPLPSVHSSSPTLQLTAGILGFCKGEDEVLPSLDDSALVGLSTSVLKQLSITSGSLILIKNGDGNISRIGQAVVLDPPNADENSSNNPSISSHSPRIMRLLPSYTYPQSQSTHFDPQVAYLSPILAFNLNLHLSCLKYILHRGKETLSSLFEVNVDGDVSEEDNELTIISLGIEPWSQLPKYASHLRVSFVKIPQCGTLETLKSSSSIEAKDRQDLIDFALNNYFAMDRYLARGDLFNICIKWNCNSELCIPCSQNMQNGGSDIIYFKVASIEPSEELVLRVNRSKTALVLGGSVPSAVPPDLLIPGPKNFTPLQGNTVQALASILTPTLCSSTLSSKFRVAILLYGLPGCGKRTVIKHVARKLGLHVVEYSCHNLLASSERKTSAAVAEAFNTAHRYAPTILLLRHFDVFRNLASQEGSPQEQVGVSSEVASVIREYTEPVLKDEDDDFEEKIFGDPQFKVAERINRHPVLLVAAADSSEGLPPTVRRCFSHEISMGPLTEEQRIQLLSQSFQTVSELTSSEDLIKDIVGQTSGFLARDLRALVADAGANLISSTSFQEEKFGSVEKSKFSLDSNPVENCGPTENAPRNLGKEDIIKALERSKKRNASALGTPKVPNVKWEDVGGLEDVKKSILDTVQLPLLHKDLFSSGLRKRSGVLLYGPPGTGKTLLAKAVATECSLNFLSVKGPELINMYIGESEKNVREIFQKARSARPCVIFFDELDSLAPARGASGDSGGVMDRVVSQMLAEIDGLNDATQDLFIIGASNRPDLIDPALLRPGRFDKLLYVGVNSEASYRERVLEALTRKFKLHKDVSLYEIAKKCPPNFTGADMYALCADAWFHAAKRKVLVTDSDLTASHDQPDSIVVEYEDFLKVVGDLSPSLSMAELRKYELLREQLQGTSR
ncbi:unnamed protein product [Fraxinus pennsylvanica]|uniref:Peroxisomal ATPase PEX6 n=1 Tax=Fraxinus pennsylvanica TaxID=56036 RepID=A0AAD1ZII7_9LAMI|nr:unnamed protein product [Fraxinus pennsylvanica]